VRLRAALVFGLALSAPWESARSQSISLDSLGRIGSDRYFDDALRVIGCPSAPVGAGTDARIWVPQLAEHASRAITATLGTPRSVPAGSPVDSRILSQASAYTFREVVFTGRFGVSEELAYVLSPEPMVGVKPLVILLHPSGTLPIQAFGPSIRDNAGLMRRTDSLSFLALGAELVRQGFVVMAPLLGSEPAERRGIAWGGTTVLGTLLREKSGVGGPLTLYVAGVQGAIDYALAQLNVRSDQIYLVGKNEGAFLAGVVASLDQRVQGVARLGAPIDRRSFRMGQTGASREAPFARADCTISDVVLAASLGGRPLLYASSEGDADDVAQAGQVSTSVVDSLRTVYAVAGKPQNLEFTAHKTNTAAAQAIASWAVRLAGTTLAPADSMLRRAFIPRLPRGYEFPEYRATQRLDVLARYIAKYPSCRSLMALATAGETTSQRFKDAVRVDLGLKPAGSTSARMRSRALLDSSRGYMVSRVEIGRPGGGTFVALLAEPHTAETQVPAVLAFNGNDSLDELFGFGPRPRSGYLNAYADALVRRGFVVLVPVIPTWVPNAFGALAAAQTGGRQTSWTVIVDVFEQAVDALLGIPSVDPDRLAAYGISFGGSAASVSTALDRRIRALVYSNFPVDNRAEFDKTAGGFATTWAIAGCSTLDAALVSIAPRPIIWEAGNEALIVGDGSDVISRVRGRYRAVGADDAFSYLRHWGGHETLPELLRIFNR
jgi:dienelactone hydrolase